MYLCMSLFLDRPTPALPKPPSRPTSPTPSTPCLQPQQQQQQQQLRFSPMKLSDPVRVAGAGGFGGVALGQIAAAGRVAGAAAAAVPATGAEVGAATVAAAAGGGSFGNSLNNRGSAASTAEHGPVPTVATAAAAAGAPTPLASAPAAATDGAPRSTAQSVGSLGLSYSGEDGGGGFGVWQEGGMSETVTTAAGVAAHGAGGGGMGFLAGQGSGFRVESPFSTPMAGFSVLGGYSPYSPYSLAYNAHNYHHHHQQQQQQQAFDELTMNNDQSRSNDLADDQVSPSRPLFKWLLRAIVLLEGYGWVKLLWEIEKPLIFLVISAGVFTGVTLALPFVLLPLGLWSEEEGWLEDGSEGLSGGPATPRGLFGLSSSGNGGGRWSGFSRSEGGFAEGVVGARRRSFGSSGGWFRSKSSSGGLGGGSGVLGSASITAATAGRAAAAGGEWEAIAAPVRAAGAVGGVRGGRGGSSSAGVGDAGGGSGSGGGGGGGTDCGSGSGGRSGRDIAGSRASGGSGGGGGTGCGSSSGGGSSRGTSGGDVAGTRGTCGGGEGTNGGWTEAASVDAAQGGVISGGGGVSGSSWLRRRLTVGYHGAVSALIDLDHTARIKASEWMDAAVSALLVVGLLLGTVALSVLLVVQVRVGLRGCRHKLNYNKFEFQLIRFLVCVGEKSHDADQEPCVYGLVCLAVRAQRKTCLLLGYVLGILVCNRSSCYIGCWHG